MSSIFRSRSIARVIGVIDVRDGLAVHARGGRRDEYRPIGEDADTLAARAAAAGAGAIIVLDLARVGMRTGLDLNLLARVKAAVPAVELIAGGGVRGVDDLATLADAGCDAALVATALQDGSLATLKGSPYS